MQYFISKMSLSIIKGCLLDPEFERQDVMITCSIHASGISTYGYLGSLFTKYPYGDVIRERRRFHDKNFAIEQDRPKVGTTLIRHPPPSSSHQPTIASLISQYGEFSPSTWRDKETTRCEDPTHRQCLAQDTSMQRKLNFTDALMNLARELRDHPWKYSHINTIIIPYLSGCADIGIWNGHYLSVVEEFALCVGTYFKKNVVLCISRTVAFLIKENPLFDKMCGFSSTMEGFDSHENFKSYMDKIEWQSSEKEKEKKNSQWKKIHRILHAGGHYRGRRSSGTTRSRKRPTHEEKKKASTGIFDVILDDDDLPPTQEYKREGDEEDLL